MEKFRGLFTKPTTYLTRMIAIAVLTVLFWDIMTPFLFVFTCAVEGILLFLYLREKKKK